MLWQIFEDYFVIFSIGLIIWVLIARYYYERVSNQSLGRILEGVIISDNIAGLQEYTMQLESLLMNMRVECDDLIDQVKRFRDIEGTDEDMHEEIK
jgi:hypothetical protein